VSFYWKDEMGSLYSTLSIVSIVLLLMYSSYFVIIAYVAFFQISDMKKSYKFSLYMTFTVIGLSIVIMMLNGYSNHNDSKYNLPLLNCLAVLYVAMYSLFNIYMYIISYLYSPFFDGLDDI
jgi:hypothetical protein